MDEEAVEVDDGAGGEGSSSSLELALRVAAKKTGDPRRPMRPWGRLSRMKKLMKT